MNRNIIIDGRIRHLQEIIDELGKCRDCLFSDCSGERNKGFYNLGCIITAIQITKDDLQDYVEKNFDDILS